MEELAELLGLPEDEAEDLLNEMNMDLENVINTDWEYDNIYGGEYSEE